MYAGPTMYCKFLFVYNFTMVVYVHTEKYTQLLKMNINYSHHSTETHILQKNNNNMLHVIIDAVIIIRVELVHCMVQDAYASFLVVITVS